MVKIGDQRPLLERFRSPFQGTVRHTRPVGPASSLELLPMKLILETIPHLSVSSHLSLRRTCSLFHQMTHVSMEYLSVKSSVLVQHDCFGRDAFGALVEI